MCSPSLHQPSPCVCMNRAYETEIVSACKGGGHWAPPYLLVNLCWGQVVGCLSPSLGCPFLGHKSACLKDWIYFIWIIFYLLHIFVDINTILQSVSKTKRCVIIHEAAKTCGVGAEISALVNEHLFGELQEPVLRVTGYDTVMPYFKLEQSYIPSVERITRTVMSIME